MNNKRILCLGLFFRAFVSSIASDTEVLEYQLQINPLISAKAIIRNEYGLPGSTDLCVRADVTTRGLAQRIFPIDNRYQTWIDTTTFLPVRSDKQIEQKNIHQHLIIEYDHRRACATTGQGDSWSIIPGCQTLFSLLPHLRRLTIHPQDSLTVWLEIESHLWRLHGQASPVEESETGTQIRLLFDFEPAAPIRPRPWKTDLLHNRISRDDTRLIVWLETQGNRLPLRLLFSNDRFMVDMRLIERRMESTP